MDITSALERLRGASLEAAIVAGRTLADQQSQLLPLLRGWTNDADTIDVACGVLLGVGEQTPLVYDHQLYWGVMAYALKDPRPATVRVLAKVFDMPGAGSGLHNHVRHIFRRLWENLDEVTDVEVRIAIEVAGVAWELKPVDGLPRAWNVLVAATTTRDSDVVAVGDCRNVHEHVESGKVVAADRLLADFVRANPGVLEREILARLDELAGIEGWSKPALSSFLESGSFFGTETWRLTHAALDHALALKIFCEAQARDLLDPTSQHNSFHVALEWVRRGGPGCLDGLDAAPEMRDVLRALVDGVPLPPILPDLAGWSPEQIEAELARYIGGDVARLYQRMASYIGKTARIGEQIARDAATLRSLGVTREALANRLLAVLRGDAGGLHVWRQSYMGHAHDPFHIYDAYELHGHLGATDFAIAKGATEIRGGDLQAELIRRACFFGTAGSYRIEPATAVDVLF